jgi:hypothetical protein
MGFSGPNGRYVRDDAAIALKLPINYSMADATALFKVPADVKLAIESLMWEVLVGFTGGTNSAIGVSSDLAVYNTKGDLLGGASGQLTAVLGTAGYKGGTIGAKFGSNGVVVLTPGSIIRLDLIASQYTAGSGFVHVLGRQIA